MDGQLIVDHQKDGRSTHCYYENPRALGFRNYHNRDTMGFTTSHLGISLMTSIIGDTRFFYKKPGEGPSSKSFLFLAKNCVFLVPKVSYLVS